uniref:Coiled-coil domain-containing protein 181 n=1 Tax=Amphilophus citrinellus TaxID=61819 RepID=A0A3Q0S6L7_AMPCI
MSETACSKAQEEYEDDFEKDLDWLISEEGQSEDQVGLTQSPLEEDDERWPSPMEPLEYDSDRDSSSKSSPIVPPPPEMDDQTDEEKKYILEKIQQANRELQDQEVPDMTRRRRLHFKETLVDLVVPPLQFEKDGNMSGKLSELKISPRDESRRSEGGSSRAGESSEGGQGMKEGRVLVEKDGKFDLVSLKEVESQVLFPPLANNFSNSSLFSPHVLEQNVNSVKSHNSSSSPRNRAGSSSFQQGIDHRWAPRPPVQPKSRPSSASQNQRGSQMKSSKRRVQSATETPYHGTYTLSPQQKEQLKKIQERKQRLAREAEQRKHEEETLKRQENELAFKVWLMKKKEQFLEERRIHRAQEIERMNCKVCPHGGTRKWAEKRAEQQAAQEHSRRLMREERRARRLRDLMCTATENKPFRFTERLAYRF